MKRIPFALAFAAALVTASPAAAKEPLSATVCGASGCNTVTDRALLNEIPGGESSLSLGASAPFYRLTVVVGEPGGGEKHTFSQYYVPSANAMAWSENGTVRLHPIYGDVAPAAMKKLVAGIQPFPRPQVTSVVVGGKRVTGTTARSYLALFAVRKEAPLEATNPTDWVAIDLKARRGSPWTDGTPDLMYAPSRNVVERGWMRYEVSGEMAADVEAARSLDGRAESSRTLFGAGIGAGALLLGVGLVLARRVRR